MAREGSQETIAALVLAQADARGTGLVWGTRSWSHARVAAASAARGAWLADRRGPGPFHVAVLASNIPEFALWLEAAALVGAVVVGANPTHRRPELAAELAHTDCQLLVAEERYWALVDQMDLGGPLGRVTRANDRVLVVGGPPATHAGGGGGGDALGGPEVLGQYAGTAPKGVADPGVDPTTLGYLLFTSGTSGAPKAVRCTQGRMARIGSVVAQMFQISPTDVCYVPMPLFHSNALMAGWAPALAAGATAALPESGRFSARGFLGEVRRCGATYFNYVGKPLAYILATPPGPDDAHNPLVRAFGNEAAPEDVALFAARFGCTVTDAYGSTEGGAVVARTPDTPAGALGRAPEGTVVLDPATGRECPPARFDAAGRLLNPAEAIGELVAKGGAAGFEGYWRNEEAEKVRLREGWYWTGDLAYRDQEGFFYFAGRDHDWLRVDGENFAAAPLVRILERHPDVVLAAVYAVPDPKVGDQVMAALELSPGRCFDPVAFDAFLDAQGDLGPKWRPRFVRVTPALPLTATHKIRTQALRAERWNGGEPVYWRRTQGGRLEVLEEPDARALEDAARRPY